MPRPSVLACCKATLATFRENTARYGALTCKSWSCPICRKVNSAQLLDRLRAGLEGRNPAGLFLMTPTVAPGNFGAHVIGTAFWDAQGRPVDDPGYAARATNLWSHPDRQSFDQAKLAMSKAWDRWIRALNARAKRRGLAPWGYFWVVELHRNLWPHLHVVLEHPTITEAPDVSSWPLGRADVRRVTIDDAVGEVAPYLVCSESKGKGHKAYQFAAPSLPRGFRLYSASRGFLAPRLEPPDPPPEHALVLRGHFTGYHQMARDWGADSRLLLPTPAPADRPHRPPSACLTTGDGAVLLYAELAEADALHVKPNTALPAAALWRQGPAHPRAGPELPPDPADHPTN